MDEAELTRAWDTLTAGTPASSLFVPQRAYASPGLVGALLDFFVGWAGDSGKRSRERTLKAADLALRQADKQTVEIVKQEMFEAVPEAHRGGARNWDELRQKLEKGELDKRAHRIYKHLNDFSPEFQEAARAINKGNNPFMAVVCEEGAKGIETGGKLYVEISKEVVGKASPDFKKGFEKGEKVVKEAKRYADYVKNVYKGDLEGLKKTVKDHLEDKVGDMLKGELGEGVADVVAFTAKRVTGQQRMVDIPEAALKEAKKNLSSLGMGTAAVADADTESPANVALAVGERASQLAVYIGNPKRDPFLLPEGEFRIIALDKEGNIDRSGGVVITAGEETVVAVDTRAETGLPPTPSAGALSLRISPETAGPGDRVRLEATLQPARRATVQITIENALSGRAATSRASTGEDGAFSAPILQITPKNLTWFSGVNTVTVKVPELGLEESAVFTVLDFKATVTPSEVAPGGRAELKVFVMPPRQTELRVRFDRGSLRGPFSTDANGMLSLAIDVDEEAAAGEHKVSVEVPGFGPVAGTSYTVVPPKKAEIREFNYGVVILQLRLEGADEDGHWQEAEARIEPSCFAKGSFDGLTFRGSGSASINGIDYTTAYTVTLDDSQSQVISFDCSFSGSGGERIRLTGSNIKRCPEVEKQIKALGIDAFAYRIEGTATGKHVSSLEMVDPSYTGTWSYQWTDSSEITIILANSDEAAMRQAGLIE